MSRNQDISPILVEIIRNALNSTAQEMNTSLFRSAYSPVIYEMKDCSVGIFNRAGELLGQSSGLPIFLGNLGICVQIITERVGIGNYREGDVYIMNDSYLQGTHLSDITVISPVFYRGELTGFAATRAAMMDIGGKDAATSIDTTEIYQEGLRIPPLKLVDAGQLREDVLDLLALNSRFHRVMKGDLKAQIAACRTGEARLREIYGRFGLEVVELAVKEIFRQSELLDRAAVAALPEGSYTAEGYLDSDGITQQPYKVAVRVDIHGDEMKIDLTGSAKTAKGAINCGVAQTVSACRVAFKQLIDPESPISGGTFRNLRIDVPEKTIFAAEEPDPCNWYYSSLGLLIDLIGRALAPAMPERAAAAHYGDSMLTVFTGKDPQSGEPFAHVEATVGGWGAYEGGDGESGMINVVNGDFKNLPVEFVENRSPLRVLAYGIVPDSEGAGKYRGGFGVYRDFLVEADECYLTLWFERSRTPAWGLFGGGEAAPPVVIINPGTSGEQRLLKVNRLKVERGTVVRAVTGGGGGFGAPRERAAERTLADVENEYISRERAAETYGVKTAELEGTERTKIPSALEGASL